MILIYAIILTFALSAKQNVLVASTNEKVCFILALFFSVLYIFYINLVCDFGCRMFGPRVFLVVLKKIIGGV